MSRLLQGRVVYAWRHCSGCPGGFRLLRLLAVIVVAAQLAGGGKAWAQRLEVAPDVVEITSDTAAYCTLLAERAEAAPMPTDAKTLHDQGVQLCARGRLRLGITRLRRALLLTEESNRR